MRPQTLEQYQESLAAHIQAKGQLLFESEVLEGGSPEQVSKYWTGAVQDWLAEAKRKSGQRGAGGSKLPALSGFFKKLEA
ncbi:hypothetical protein, partial [Vibrio cholerae]|uniref:hypothetical protein n=1 Tax=Vibrio cholerae TaxID=666 RepID=UPI00301D3FB7